MAKPTPTQNGSWQVYPDYTGTDGVSAPVYLLPTSFTYGQSSTVTVAQLYLGGSGFASYAFSNADFAFSFQSQKPTPPYQASVLAQVVISGQGNMWKCAATARAALAANFQALLAWVESTLELPGIVVPGSTSRIGRTVMDALPLAFGETLALHYSLSTGLTGGTNAHVDLVPGMRLLLETSVSQFLSPSAPQNGYVSTAAVPLAIGSLPGPDGRRVVTFDPFLGTINAPVVTPVGKPVQIAGGLIDLQAPGQARVHWRLFYPTSMAPPNQPGNAQLVGNVGLMASDTLATLAAATTAYPTTVSDGGPGGKPLPTLYYAFLGRAIAIPQIPVWLTANGQTAVDYVPVGTTIANIVERYTDPPLSQPGNVVAVMRNVYGGNPASVRFMVASLPATPLAMYDLPLLAGDGVTLTV
ncbi:MAG: hypothetical protein ACJ74O_04965 [Frankiaceae bacterium]